MSIFKWKKEVGIKNNPTKWWRNKSWYDYCRITTSGRNACQRQTERARTQRLTGLMFAAITDKAEGGKRRSNAPENSGVTMETSAFEWSRWIRGNAREFELLQQHKPMFLYTLDHQENEQLPAVQAEPSLAILASKDRPLLTIWFRPVVLTYRALNGQAYYHLCWLFAKVCCL